MYHPTYAGDTGMSAHALQKAHNLHVGRSQHVQLVCHNLLGGVAMARQPVLCLPRVGLHAVASSPKSL